MTSAPAFTPPSNSELDCLMALWGAAAAPDSNHAMRVSEIHRQVCSRRRQLGETEPTVVTISSQMRSLLQKNLVKCVVGSTGESQQVGKDVAMRTRGMLSPTSRSPLTAYQYLFQPGEVLQSTFMAIIAAYPEPQRPQSLVDFAAALAAAGALDALNADAKLALLSEVATTLRFPPKLIRRLKADA